jgi:hypothetical protein
VFGNRVLRNVCGAKRDDVTKDWKRSHKEGLHSLHALPNTIWVIKSRRMRWSGHVAQEMPTGFWWGSLRERVHFKDLHVDGRIIFKFI